jgi:Domain of unknown function (DUF5658)
MRLQNPSDEPTALPLTTSPHLRATNGNSASLGGARPCLCALAFALLSLVDFALTFRLLTSGNGTIYESNPIAHWCLTQYGWAGLAIFKIAVVSLVLFLSVTISGHHPRAGRGVLAFACAVLVPVVLYSSALVGFKWHRDAQEELVEQNRSLDSTLAAEMQETAEYAALVNRLSGELAFGRCSLAEAVHTLQALERSHDLRCLAVLHTRFPGQSDEACLAANLVAATLGGYDGDPGALARPLPLAAELDATYGIPVPFAQSFSAGGSPVSNETAVPPMRSPSRS